VINRVKNERQHVRTPRYCLEGIRAPVRFGMISKSGKMVSSAAACSASFSRGPDADTALDGIYRVVIENPSEGHTVAEGVRWHRI
jgi:hypothetical protein